MDGNRIEDERILKYGLKKDPLDIGTSYIGIDINPIAIFMTQHCINNMHKRKLYFPTVPGTILKISILGQYLAEGSVLGSKTFKGFVKVKGGYFIVKAYKNKKTGKSFLKVLTAIKDEFIEKSISLRSCSYFSGIVYVKVPTKIISPTNFNSTEWNKDKILPEKVYFDTGRVIDYYFETNTYTDTFNDIGTNPTYKYDLFENFVRTTKIPDDLMEDSVRKNLLGLGKGYSKILHSSGKPLIFL